MANKVELPPSIWAQILKLNQNESRVSKLEKIMLAYSNYFVINDTL